MSPPIKPPPEATRRPTETIRPQILQMAITHLQAMAIRRPKGTIRPRIQATSHLTQVTSHQIMDIRLLMGTTKHQPATTRLLIQGTSLPTVISHLQAMATRRPTVTIRPQMQDTRFQTPSTSRQEAHHQLTIKMKQRHPSQKKFIFQSYKP